MRAALLGWYDLEGRDLPFRHSADPWAVLVSETMAQQTQAARAGEAWRTFMTRFPTAGALAEATAADVLRAWRGLGYNRRAIDLQRAAAAIVGRHGGVVPSDLAALEGLPGVGPYTARAVAAFAFGLPVGPVDTNVRRVLERVIEGDDTRLPRRRLQALADELADPGRPSDWSHALMDVGATRCRPLRPDCAACPLRLHCRYAMTARSSPPPAPRPATHGATRERAAPFEMTSRWLRGRIVDLLREGDDDAWVALGPAIGSHDHAAVGVALAALAREGLLERDPTDPRRARLPTRAEPVSRPKPTS